MSLIYVTDETKKILEKVAELDHRTQDGEINYLLDERLKELSTPSDNSGHNSTKNG
jgi:hypothetical protein